MSSVLDGTQGRRRAPRRQPALALLLLPLLSCGESPPDPPPSSTPALPAVGSSFPLVDVTAESGVDFVHDSGARGRRLFVETMAPGLCLFDADDDGDLDLYAVDGGPLPAGKDPPTNRLYLNDGEARFRDATEGSGADDAGYGMGCIVGDIDGDGRLDLYVLNYGPNGLYRNLGEGRFERQAVGVEDPAWSVSGAFFDLEGDGDLDLFVVNYLDYDVDTESACRAGSLEIYCSPELYEGVADRLFRNDGGLFVDVSESVGLAPGGRGMGVAAADLDGNGLQDLYVTNDRSANFLYWNEGGNLREAAAETGTAYALTGRTEGGMGALAADFTGGGTTDIFLTNFHREPFRLYVAAGDGFFDDHTARSGLAMPTLERVGWGMAAFDLEGDGDLDLAVANGHVWDNAEQFIPGSSWKMPDQLFLNDGHGRFRPRDFPAPHLSSRGVARGDFDGDGDPDLVIASCNGPLRLWRNEAGNAARWLVVELRQEGKNSHAYGALLQVSDRGRSWRREVTGGSSYASHSDSRIYLALPGGAQGGDAGNRFERIEVRWPDGQRETLEGVAPGRSIRWQKGLGIVAERPLLEGA